MSKSRAGILFGLGMDWGWIGDRGGVERFMGGDRRVVEGLKVRSLPFNAKHDRAIVGMHAALDSGGSRKNFRYRS